MWATYSIVSFLGICSSLLSPSLSTIIRRQDEPPPDLPEVGRVNEQVQMPRFDLSDPQVYRTIARMQIVCKGRVPFEFYQAYDEMFPSQVSGMRSFPTVRSICSLPLNEPSRIWNAGLYCGWRLSHPRVVFSDIGGYGQILPSSALWEYIAIFCQSRCRCLDLDRQHIALTDPVILAADENPFMNLDLNPIRVLPDELNIRINLIGHHGPNIPATVLDIQETLNVNEEMPVAIVALIPQQGSYIPKCDGPLPPTRLPAPFTDHYFPNLQILCTAEVFGGDPQGNVGAVCMLSPKHNDVLKFDPFYQHPALWERASAEAYAAHVWCQIHCSCNSLKPTTRVKAFEKDEVGLYQPKFAKGGLVLFKRQGGKNTKVVIIPEGGSGKSYQSNLENCALISASSYTKDTSSVCDPMLGVDLSKGAPEININQEAYPLPIKHYSALRPPIVLGRYNEQAAPESCAASPPATCESFKDCASSLTSTCRCALSMARNMANVVSLATALTTFTCVSTSSRVAAGGYLAGRLGGRDGGLEDWVCPCNGTFASTSCCEQVDGMVWTSGKDEVELRL